MADPSVPRWLQRARELTMEDREDYAWTRALGDDSGIGEGGGWAPPRHPGEHQGPGFLVGGYRVHLQLRDGKGKLCVVGL